MATTEPVYHLRLTWRCQDCGAIRWRKHRGRIPKRCRRCSRANDSAYNRRYYQRHREELLARHKAWWAANAGRYARKTNGEAPGLTAGARG